MVTVYMDFATIGAEDSLDEAKLRLESVDALVVWGGEKILGVLTKEHLDLTQVKTAAKPAN